VRYETVQLILALAALENWHMSSVDVKTAFLYGELDEELYMEQPEGFKISGKEHLVLRLKHAIYGLRQAALQWWKPLDKSMAKLGFKQLLSDSGIFVYKDKKGAPKVIVIVYVDDAIFLERDMSIVRRVKDLFMKIWECHDLGDTKEFLCMRIVRGNGYITIDQQDYLHKVLERFDLINAKAAPTPLPMGYVPTPNEAPVDKQLRHKFQQVIGSLLYIMLGTCPDIAFAVTKLLQFAANPSKDHLVKALYICCYLIGTSDYRIIYNGRKQRGFIAYADSNWASDIHTRRSTTSYMVMLASGVISWNTRVQKTVALSSTEAEYMSLSDTCRQLQWMHSLFYELGMPIDTIPLCGDNQGAIFIASNPVQERRTKHIDICYHYIRQVLEKGEVALYFIEGSENPADMLTKNLRHVKFLKFQGQLGINFKESQ